jgi:hypothetical protein
LGKANNSDVFTKWPLFIKFGRNVDILTRLIAVVSEEHSDSFFRTEMSRVIIKWNVFLFVFPAEPDRVLPPLPLPWICVTTFPTFPST